VRGTLLGLFYEYSCQVEGPSCTYGFKTSKETVGNEDGISEDDLSSADCDHYGDQ
jgi:hypothetical protein